MWNFTWQKTTNTVAYFVRNISLFLIISLSQTFWDYVLQYLKTLADLTERTAASRSSNLETWVKVFFKTVTYIYIYEFLT
jgi:hypothetical protein